MVGVLGRVVRVVRRPRRRSACATRYVSSIQVIASSPRFVPDGGQVGGEVPLVGRGQRRCRRPTGSKRSMLMLADAAVRVVALGRDVDPAGRAVADHRDALGVGVAGAVGVVQRACRCPSRSRCRAPSSCRRTRRRNSAPGPLRTRPEHTRRRRCRCPRSRGRSGCRRRGSCSASGWSRRRATARSPCRRAPSWW